MSVRIGYISCAHMHVGSYSHHLARRSDVTQVGIWDPDLDRARAFAAPRNLAVIESLDELLAASDAVAICSENVRHLEHVTAAARAGKAILCEKPLVTRLEDASRMQEVVEQAGVVFMTAFPCRFSPAFDRLVQRVRAGEIGTVRAVCATNRGSCPWGWFVNPELSGGGAMIDHVVHVMDLLRALLQSEPVRATAQTGHRMYQESWEDTAKVTVDFENGVFATIDSSWSRPAKYKTWGDVTLNVVGDAGTIEVDLFGQAVQVYRTASPNHTLAGYGGDLDAALVAEFLDAIAGRATPRVGLIDGLQACRVFLAGYESLKTGQPVAV